MEYSHNCVIVIPLYKIVPSNIEEASFKQCLKVLKNHFISLVTYREMNLTYYTNIIQNYDIKYDIVYFEKEYFNSVQGYNQLCLSKDFYYAFTKFDYMLIYQLDAWVFKDELNYWCNQGYDYIGAPWFKEDFDTIFTKDFNGIGNGGFSLRKISYCINILNYNPYKPFINIKNLFRAIKKPLDIPKFCLKLLGIRNNISFYISQNKINEDNIFSKMVLKSNIKVHLPNEQIASQFAFEVNPSYLYKLNDKKLPFGCHAFEKFEFSSFWYKFIKL